MAEVTLTGCRAFLFRGGRRTTIRNNTLTKCRRDKVAPSLVRQRTMVQVHRTNHSTLTRTQHPRACLGKQYRRQSRSGLPSMHGVIRILHISATSMVVA